MTIKCIFLAKPKSHLWHLNQWRLHRRSPHFSNWPLASNHEGKIHTSVQRLLPVSSPPNINQTNTRFPTEAALMAISVISLKTWPPKGDEPSVEHPESNPSSRCLSEPLCIQAAFFHIWDLISVRIASCQSPWSRSRRISDRENGRYRLKKIALMCLLGGSRCTSPLSSYSSRLLRRTSFRFVSSCVSTR